MVRSGGLSGAGGLWNLGFSLVDLVKRTNDLHRLTSNLWSKLLSDPNDGLPVVRPAASAGTRRTFIRRARKTAASFLE